MSAEQNLQPFTGNCDVSIRVKNSRLGRKAPMNKQTKERSSAFRIDAMMQSISTLADSNKNIINVSQTNLQGIAANMGNEETPTVPIATLLSRPMT